MTIRLLALVLLLFLVACRERKAPVVILLPEQMRLYSIKEDPHINNTWAEKAEKIEDFPLLGKLDITDPKGRQEIIDALNQDVAEGETIGKCFNPRHAVRAIHGSSQTDYIICFECSSMHVLVDGKRKVYAIDGAAQELLHKLLREANVPLNSSR